MRTLSVIFLALGSSACLASGTQLTREKAAFDLNCPQDKVDVTMISGLAENGTGAVFGARGCGKRASYVRAQAAGVVLNSPIQDDK